MFCLRGCVGQVTKAPNSSLLKHLTWPSWAKLTLGAPRGQHRHCSPCRVHLPPEGSQGQLEWEARQDRAIHHWYRMRSNWRPDLQAKHLRQEITFMCNNYLSDKCKHPPKKKTSFPPEGQALEQKLRYCLEWMHPIVQGPDLNPGSALILAVC